MRGGRVLAGLLAVGALAACDRSERRATPPGERIQADVAAPGIPMRELCERACVRLDQCSVELAAAFETDAARAQFPFACPEECDRLEESAERAPPHADDCVALDNCVAFYSCSTGGASVAAPRRTTTASADLNCASLCARELECGGDGEAEANTAEGGCELRCEAAPRKQSPLRCLGRRSCSEFNRCTDHWRDSGYPSQEGAPPPGVSKTCDRLCSRAIECGAEQAELLDEELAELSATMSSTYMECAVQCGEELDDDNEAHFRACIAKPECKAFQECSDVL